MRHAFLICAHNNFNLLARLLNRLDDKDFDLYVHIDKKSGPIDYSFFESLNKSINIHFLRKRISVTWGDVSQIKVTFILIEEALKAEKYDYLHFISGVDYPIKSNSHIKHFFEKYQGKEFVGFTKWTPVMDEKMGYYHFFKSSQLKKHHIYVMLNKLSIKIQDIFNIRHYHDTHIFSKGCNWWSITSHLAADIYKEKAKILKDYKYSLCADEIFFQTYILNQKQYRDALFDISDEYSGCLRLIDWNRGNPYVWNLENIEEILTSKAIFARKFNEENLELLEIIDKNCK